MQQGPRQGARPFSVQGRTDSQTVALSIVRPVPIRTAEAATRLATPVEIGEEIGVDARCHGPRNHCRAQGLVRKAHDPAQAKCDCRMKQQRNRANVKDHAHVSLGAIAMQHPTKSEEGRRKAGSNQKVDSIGQHRRQGDPGQVHQEACADPQHQRVGQDRPQRLARECARRGAARPRNLHRGDAQGIAKGRVQGDDGVVRCQRVGAIGPLGDRQAQQ